MLRPASAIFAVMSRKKQHPSCVASWGLSNGDNRVLVRPAPGALAMIASAHRAARSAGGFTFPDSAISPRYCGIRHDDGQQRPVHIGINSSSGAAARVEPTACVVQDAELRSAPRILLAAVAISTGPAMTQLDDRLNEQRRLAGLVLAGAALLALSVAMLHFLDAEQYERFVGAALIQSLLYVFAVWLVVRRRWGANALSIILAVAVLARVVALFAPDTLSTDIYRYVWGGRVQAAGINTYRYVPVDPALAFLRDQNIYPHVNRAEYAPTVYPPVAQ